MRLIPQVLRYYLVLNTVRTMPVDSMMDYCGNFTHLTHIKRMILHDRDIALKSIDYYIDQLADNKFHFRYKSKKEQGKDYDPTAIWEEDIAGVTYTNWELIKVLRELRIWVKGQKDYRYPAEINS